MFRSNVKEDLLYFVWRTKSFVKENLTTTTGSPLSILNYGSQNQDSGPDFFNGRIILDGLEWSGNIEMHVYSSDWDKHNHSLDKAYNNVILHVVFEEDEDIFDNGGRKLPCLEMKSLIPVSLLDSYTFLIQAETQIPCENLFSKVDQFPLRLAMEGFAVERLERKTSYFAALLHNSKENWDEVFYIGISRYIGAKVNMQPFEQMAQATPWTELLKLRDQLIIIEAILFGQAGMLDANFKDDYFQQLKKEYAFQRQKRSLRSIPAISWKFARLRPPNFPTLRIAQLAKIIHGNRFSFSVLKEYTNIQELYQLLEVSASPYWDTHFTFGKTSGHKEKRLGRSFVNMIIINAMVPLLFLYGMKVKEQKYKDKAIALLLSLETETNKITKLFHGLGMSVNNALESQALLELKSIYCDACQCLKCPIGAQIVGKNLN